MNILIMFESLNLFKIAFSESLEGALTTKESKNRVITIVIVVYQLDSIFYNCIFVVRLNL